MASSQPNANSPQSSEEWTPPAQARSATVTSPTSQERTAHLRTHTPLLLPPPAAADLHRPPAKSLDMDPLLRDRHLSDLVLQVPTELLVRKAPRSPAAMIALRLAENAKTLFQFADLSPLTAITPTEGTLAASIPTTATRSALAILCTDPTFAILCTDPSFAIPSTDLFQFVTLFADQSQYAIPSTDPSANLAHH